MDSGSNSITRELFQRREHDTEVLPVPRKMLERVWPLVKCRLARKGLTTSQTSAMPYDTDRLYGRLLIGRDRLWVAFENSELVAVIVTSITNAPPTQMKRFQSADRAARRSLTVHLAAGRCIEAWIDNAVERITRYGVEHGCRQLFILARKGWRKYAVRFYSQAFDRVGVSRDRPLKKRTEKGFRRQRNRVGHFRLVAEAPGPWQRNFYKSSAYLYLKPEGVHSDGHHAV